MIVLGLNVEATIELSVACNDVIYKRVMLTLSVVERLLVRLGFRMCQVVHRNSHAYQSGYHILH